MQNLKYEIRGKSLAILTLNRPSVLNALNQETLKEMSALLTEISEKGDIKALILTGAGEKAFIAGADIQEMQSFTPLEMLAFAQLGQNVSNLIEGAPFLTLAVVNGYALGGGLEMALSCDFIYASDQAKLGLPEVSLGLIPSFGGTQRLSRAVGVRKAKELIMTGRIFKAIEAFDMGIVNKVCPREQLIDASIKAAEEALKNSPFAMAQAKHVIAAGWHMGRDEALELERNAGVVCFGTEERFERMANFLQKNKRA